MGKYVVRYGAMRNLGVMNSRGSDFFRRGQQVVARTSRGLEVGEVLCESNEQAAQQIDESLGGQLLREMTEDDFNELGRMGRSRQEKFDLCRQRIRELNLEMQLVDVEQIFGGERIVVYYLAEQRVDFRELVKILASDFQTRIEMRQIGVRDEAKLLADYGDCGKPVCCNTHLAKMPPVSMKMAKIQKATLDPNKISGRCGRLKCCLRYEYDTYHEIQKQLPPLGAEIVTREGRGRVLGHEILAEQVLIETEDHRRILIDQSEVLTVLPKRSGPKRGKGQDRGAEKSSAENESESTQRSSSDSRKRSPDRETDSRSTDQRAARPRSRSRSNESREGSQDKPEPDSSQDSGPPNSES